MFMQFLFGAGGGSARTVEHWQWRYRDASTGRVCRTAFRLTAEEASRYPHAERIEGTLVLRPVESRRGLRSLFRRRSVPGVRSPA
jgi:hypothetical protein